jgi:hypothetical protein
MLEQHSLAFEQVFPRVVHPPGAHRLFAQTPEQQSLLEAQMSFCERQFEGKHREMSPASAQLPGVPVQQSASALHWSPTTEQLPPLMQ